MSAILETQRDARVAAILEAHRGDADAALLACIMEIDRLARLHAVASVASSYGYSRGRLRPHAGVSSGVVTTVQEPLDV